MLAGSTDVSDIDFGGGLVGAFVGPVAVTLRGVWLAWERVAARAPELGAALAPSEGALAAPSPQDGPQVRRAKELMAVAYPRGEWQSMTIKAARHGCTKEAAARRWKLPSPDSFSIAMGRRVRR
jgi:hypothetical protein